MQTLLVVFDQATLTNAEKDQLDELQTSDPAASRYIKSAPLQYVYYFMAWSEVWMTQSQQSNKS